MKKRLKPNNLDELYNPGITLKEYAKSVHTVHTLLQCIAQGKATPKRLQRLQEQIKAIPRSYRHYIDELGPSGITHHPPGYIERLIYKLPELGAPEQIKTAKHILEYVEPFAEETKQPGQGNMRRQARKHIYEIQQIARVFQEKYPNLKISSNPESRFCHYANEQLSNKYGEGDYSRHIKNAINDLAKWRTIKKIDL